MPVSELKTFIVTCDAYLCQAAFQTNHIEGSGFSRELPEGWWQGQDTCYGSDHYYKDGYSCFKRYCPTHAGVRDESSV